MRRLPLETAVPGALVLGLCLLWAAEDGGFSDVVWYPAGPLLVVLLVVTEVAAPPERTRRLGLAALASFAGFSIWAFATVAWAADRGSALEGANRTLVYALVFAVALRRRWSPREMLLWSGAWAVGVTAIGVVGLVEVARAGDVAASFEGGRLTTPIAYANANAALFVLASWPLTILAQLREAPPLVRGAALGAAGVALELGVLGQSKGAVLGGVATLGIFLLAAPGRMRRAVPWLLVLAALLAFRHRLLGVFTELNGLSLATGAVRAALLAVASTFALLAAAGVLLASVDRRWPRGYSTRASRATNAAGVVLVLLAVLSAGAGVARAGGPSRLLSQTWHSFKNPPRSSAAASHFVTSAGNNRYDFWRVAALQFRSAPVWGVGIDNFAADYVALRRSAEEPRYPHSLEARLLGGTGATGFLLFAAWAAAVLAACRAAIRRGEATTGLVAGAMLLYWLLHGSVDWLWEFPALSAPVLFLAGAASAGAPAAPRRPAGGHRRPELAILAVAALAALVLLVPPWLAARSTVEAVTGWRSNPQRSYAALDRAARLNRLAESPYLIGGTIAMRRGEWARAGVLLQAALRRNRRNWYSRFELALARAEVGDRAGALRDVQAAERLDPREPILDRLHAQLLAGRRVRARALNDVLLRRVESPASGR